MADINLSGVRKDIQIDQGSTVEIIYELRDQDSLVLDMTGYDLRMQVRESYSSASTLLNCTIANGLLAWVSQSTGKFRLFLSPVDTMSIRFSKDSPDTLEAVYDLEVTAPTENPGTSKPWYGSFVIQREVTR